jgi:hypothetical protein
MTPADVSTVLSMRAVVVLVAVLVALAVSASSLAAGNSTDLSMTREVSPSPMRVRQSATVTYTVSNLGPDPAPSVRWLLHFPAQVDYVSITTSAGSCEFVYSDLVCQLGALAVGQTVEIALDVLPQTRSSTGGASLEGGVDRNQDNNKPAFDFTAIAPVGGIGTVRSADASKILKTGGMNLRVVPNVTGKMNFSAEITTPSGPLNLTPVYGRKVTRGKPLKVFLGSEPRVLAAIRKALKHHASLPAKITLHGADTYAHTTLHVRR